MSSPLDPTRADVLYEGKAKRLYETDREGVLWVEYLDQATAFDGKKKDSIAGKGTLNSEISALLFEYLAAEGIPSHLLKTLGATEQLVRRVDIIPLEVVVRNVAAGSLSKRIGWAEGTALPRTIVEFYFKNDDLSDPHLSEEHIDILQLASQEELADIRRQALAVNEALGRLFDEVGIDLVDFKIEFGRTPEGEILLADEISPDNCRLWEKGSGRKLDKDVYRRDLGDLVSVYEEVRGRLQEHLGQARGTVQ